MPGTVSDSTFCSRNNSKTNSIDSMNVENFNVISSDVSIIKLPSTLSFDSDEVVQVVTKVPNDRETWHGRLDFLLSCLGYAGAFLIPFLTFLLFLGIPLVFLELSIGQFTSTGPLTSWSMVPIFRGIGLSMSIVNGYLCIYYNMVIAYSIYFMVLSLRPILSWQSCDVKWSSANCIDNYTNFVFTKCSNRYENLKCDDGRCYSYHNQTNVSCSIDNSNLQQIGWWNPSFPTEDFWKKVILKQSDSINETGYLVWELVLCLFFSWVIVFTLVVKGIKVSGQLQYFTSLTPYIILLILGIRGWLLPGAASGIKYYVTPNFEKLKDVQCWIDAALQVFFTLSISYGGLIALSSYNNYHKNIMRDAIIVSLSNCITSVLAGFVIFAYIGYLSQETGQNVDQVIRAGQGLAYVVWPFAVTKISGAPFWAFMFFFMMIILGVDSMMASVESLNTSILDLIPKLKKTHLRKILTITFLCTILFLLGLIFCTQAGSYWLQLFDSYSGNWAILIVSGLELISIGWFYGFDNYRKDISTMIGTKITNHLLFNLWRICWNILSPAIIFTLVVAYFVNVKDLKSDNYIYPDWTKTFGNLLTASSLSGVVIWAICLIIDALFIHKKPIIGLFKPSKKFKPLRPEHQILVSLVHSNCEEENNKRTDNNLYF